MWCPVLYHVTHSYFWGRHASRKILCHAQVKAARFFFLLKNSARNFFLTRNICSIFFLGFAQPPHQKSNGPTLSLRKQLTPVSPRSSPPRETSPAAKSEEKRSFRRLRIFPLIFISTIRQIFCLSPLLLMRIRCQFFPSWIPFEHFNFCLRLQPHSPEVTSETWTSIIPLSGWFQELVV